jgi:putative lipoic acid-binding regulatory protein
MPDAQPPPLEYPALYVFRLIGRRSPGLREHVRLLIQSVVGVLPDEALTERKSSAGAYLALHVSCLLTSEEQRREVYLKLKADPQVVFTL